MTKRHEGYLVGTAREVLVRLREEGGIRGEFVCVVEGGGDQPGLSVQRTMAVLAGELPPSQAAKLGAALLGVNRRELYELATEIRGKSSK